MRQHGGGLVCLALENQFGKSMGLRYMHEILDESLDLESHKMIPNRAPYGDRPSFSIHVNHRSTYTGITDTDRALTAREIAKLYGKPNLKEKFVSSFVTPGHLPLLLASKGMLAERRGHTGSVRIFVENGRIVSCCIDLRDDGCTNILCTLF